MKRWKRRRPLVVPPPAAPAAGQGWPRLRVWHDRYAHRCRWDWHIVTPNGDIADHGSAATHPEALAVGMAHLAVHTAAWAIDEHGAQLPAGWERIHP